METPCTNVCQIDPASGLCLGCRRTIDEITSWQSLSDQDRARIMDELSVRSGNWDSTRVSSARDLSETGH